MNQKNLIPTAENALTFSGVGEAEQRTREMAARYRCEFIDLRDYHLDAELFKTIPVDLMFRYNFVPLEDKDGTLWIAIADPSKLMMIDEIGHLLGRRVKTKVCTLAQISDILKKTEQSQRVLEEASEGFVLDVVRDEEGSGDENITIGRITAEADISPMIRLVDTTIFTALQKRASDIHIETESESVVVKYRIDGVLQPAMAPMAKEHHSTIITRIKVMSELDIAERRVPQDGRFRVKYNGRLIDFRVSIMPTIHGENAVLRVLDKESMSEKFRNLVLDVVGFDEEDLRKFRRYILEPYGMVLVTGPTGSGKTNTLYSSISRLNQPDTNIMTAEDPVEFQLGGVNQVQMKEQIGLNFAAALRSFLRQDPNIILVGEIRDFETAEIAIKAALTGHLVLSTLHTNGAPETITRLMNMGIEPFLVATSVHLICAQRLIRRICKECSETVDVPIQTLIEEGFSPEEAKTIKIQKGKGCGVCNNTGYKGRCGLYEVMEVDDEIRELVLVGASAVELKKKAIERGMITLRRSGLIKVAAGITTLEEVARETIH